MVRPLAAPRPRRVCASFSAALLALVGCAACGGGGPAASSDLGPPDLAPTTANLTGKWALGISITFGGGDAGAATPDHLYALANLYEPLAVHADGTHDVMGVWQLCGLDPAPGLSIPFDDSGLAQYMNDPGAGGTVLGDADDAPWTQPVMPFVIGAQLRDPMHDPLPVDASNMCSSTSAFGCVTANAVGTHPGVHVTASGLTPDASDLWIDARLLLALQAKVGIEGILTGQATQVGTELHVLDCTLRGGTPCSRADIAALEAARPQPTITGGALRGHIQGFYYTCPELLANPDAALAGVDADQDGGLPDGGTASMSFPLVQADVDAVGCATGGCHEQLAPPHMHLTFRPSTAAQLRANYEAIMPWTTAPGTPGGRFVNEVPLGAAMRARWLDWIAQGSPF